MNNLKRVLSMALASVSLIGTMAVGANAADFPDRDKIAHKEAVDVLTALNVINGKEDGTFAPDEKVTRGQMAKMLYVAYTGTDVDPGTTSYHPFTDTANNWSAGYVEACATFGIIAGRGDGTFDPDGVVTTTEVAKMVLAALGYDAKAYGLTGVDWATATQKYARAADPKLFEGLSNSVVLNAPATRDVAAQIIWNGLQNTVKVTDNEWNYGSQTGSGRVEKYGDGHETLLTQTFKAHVAQGTFNGNYYFNKGNAEKKNDINISNAVSKDATKLWEDKIGFTVRLGDDQKLDIANIGEQVRVIWKDSEDPKTKDSNTEGRPDKYDHIFGVFVTGASQGVQTTMDKVEDNKSTDKTIIIDGTSYELADEVVVYTNYRETQAFTGGDLVGSKNENSALTAFLKHAEGSTLKTVTEPATGKINKIYLVRSDVAKVTAVNSSTITMNNNVGEISISNNDVEEGLQKDDVVAVTVLYQENADNDDAFVIVKKAEKVSGKVDGHKEGKNGTQNITVDGKTYKVMDTTDNQKGEAMKKSGLTDAVDTITNNNHGDTFDLYLVNGFVRAAVQDTATASNYSVIIDVQGTDPNGRGNNALKVWVLTSEGKEEELAISEKSDYLTSLNSDTSVGAIVTYSKDSNGKAKIKSYQKTSTGSVAYKSNTQTLNGMDITKNAVLFYTDKDNKWQTKQLQSTSSTEYGTKPYALVTNSDKKVVAVAVKYGDTVGGSTENVVYGIVTKDNGSTSIGGVDYSTYTVQAGGEKYEVNYEGSLAKGNIVSFAPQEDKTYETVDVKILSKTGDKDVASYEIFLGYVDSYTEGKKIRVASDVTYEGDGYVAAGVQTTYLIDNDTKIFGVWVDPSNSSHSSSAEPSISELSSTQPYANVIVVAEMSGKGEYTAKALIVNTSKADIVSTNATSVEMTVDGTHAMLNLGNNGSYDNYESGAKISFAIAGTVSNLKLNGAAYTSGKDETLSKGNNNYTLSFTKDGRNYVYNVTVKAN